MKRILKYILLFIISFLFQVLIFDKAYFYGYFNVYVYILFILLLPVDLNKNIVLLLGFLLGITVDVFNSTLGIHAAATVFMTYFRPSILRGFSPHDGYELNKNLGIINYGFKWFFKYAISLILLHHTFLIILDTWSFYNFGHTFIKIVFSVFASLLFIIMGDLLIMKK